MAHGRRSTTRKPAGLSVKTLVSEALLDLFDPGLERGDVPPQFGEVALEDLAPAELVREACLDPAQRLRDRMVLLLESVESPVDLVEVPEHLPPQVGDLTVDLVEAAVDLIETARDLVEAAVDLVEAAVDLVQAAVDLGELASEKFDELLMLGRGHGP